MAKDDYPYIWTFEAMPTGKKGKRCRVIATSKKDRSQGLVMIQFQEPGPDYLVRRKGLQRVT